MIAYFDLTTTTTSGVPFIGPPCPSIENALRGAKSLLGDGGRLLRPAFGPSACHRRR